MRADVEQMWNKCGASVERMLTECGADAVQMRGECGMRCECGANACKCVQMRCGCGAQDLIEFD